MHCPSTVFLQGKGWQILREPQHRQNILPKTGRATTNVHSRPLREQHCPMPCHLASLFARDNTKLHQRSGLKLKMSIILITIIPANPEWHGGAFKRALEDHCLQTDHHLSIFLLWARRSLTQNIHVCQSHRGKKS